MLCVNYVTFDRTSFQEQVNKIIEKNFSIKDGDLLSNSCLTTA